MAPARFNTSAIRAHGTRSHTDDNDAEGPAWMPPDTEVPSPSSYCYTNRLSNRQTTDAAINKCPTALDRQKKPNSALCSRDTSEDHPEQDSMAQQVERLERQMDTPSGQMSTIPKIEAQ